MKNLTEIAVTLEELEQREERITKTQNFEIPDRVPVLPGLAHRYLIPKTSVSFKEYYSDPEMMLKGQIEAQKWLMENIKTDAHSITGAWVGAWTDFQNTFEAGSLGVNVVFPDDDIPWVGPGWVKDETDLKKLEQMDFVHSGINQKQLEFREKMIEVAEKYPVTFLDGKVFYPGSNPSLTHTSDGPFGVAGDVMGQTELFTAVYEKPEFVKELLHIITEKLINYLDNCWEVEQLPTPKDFSWTDDLAVSLSPEVFSEIVLPYEKKLRFHFDGFTSLHMCGKSDHLLEIFRDDLKIHQLQGFGYQVDLDYIGEVMGGKVVLIGNIYPIIIYSGTPEEVKAATKNVIDTLGHFKGLIIQDGNNIPPDSPIENINAMMEAAEAYGRYER